MTSAFDIRIKLNIDRAFTFVIARSPATARRRGNLKLILVEIASLRRLSNNPTFSDFLKKFWLILAPQIFKKGLIRQPVRSQ